MPTPTYTLIQEQVLTSAATSVTFTAIPQTYKDLVLQFVGQTTGTATAVGSTFRVNGDSGGNYSYTYLSGNGSSASSNRGTNTVYAVAPGASSNVQSAGSIHFFSYANTNIWKTTIAESNVPDGGVAKYANLWRNTAAITSITFYSPDNGSASVPFIAGSTFRLYGLVG